MTNMQLQYWALEEEKRRNRVQEQQNQERNAETERANRVRENQQRIDSAVANRAKTIDTLTGGVNRVVDFWDKADAQWYEQMTRSPLKWLSDATGIRPEQLVSHLVRYVSGGTLSP